MPHTNQNKLRRSYISIGSLIHFIYANDTLSPGRDIFQMNKAMSPGLTLSQSLHYLFCLKIHHANMFLPVTKRLC